MSDSLPQSVSGSGSTRFRRVQLSLWGRYMTSRSGEAFPCQTFEMSPGDVSLFAPFPPLPDHGVILYVDELGRMTGRALRATEQGFEMTLQLTSRKRDSLADRLTCYANRSCVDLQERGRRDRFVPLMDLTVLRLWDGSEHIVRIQTLSLSGVAIETDRVIPVGESLFVGTTPARVTRITDDGLACEFRKPFRPGQIDERTRL